MSLPTTVRNITVRATIERIGESGIMEETTVSLPLSPAELPDRLMNLILAASERAGALVSHGYEGDMWGV